MLLNARNKLVTRQLQAQYGCTTNLDLKVFCVSNKWYDKYNSTEGQGNPIQIRASGIPQLRAFCCLIPAQAQFEAVAHFLDVQIPGLLKGIDLWTKSGQATRASGLVTAVAKPVGVSKTVFENVSTLPNSSVLTKELESIINDAQNNSIRVAQSLVTDVMSKLESVQLD